MTTMFLVFLFLGGVIVCAVWAHKATEKRVPLDSHSTFLESPSCAYMLDLRGNGEGL